MRRVASGSAGWLSGNWGPDGHNRQRLDERIGQFCTAHVDGIPDTGHRSETIICSTYRGSVHIRRTKSASVSG